MDKIWTYCQEDFLLYFFDNYVVDPTDIKNRICNCFYDLLLKNAEILIDSDKKINPGNPNPYIKHLAKSSTSGGSRITELSGYFQGFKENENIVLENNPTSLHFLKIHHFQNLNEFGVCISDSLNYLTSINTISSKPTSIKVHPKNELNEFGGWNEFTAKLPPRNSLIIADNHFLKNEKTYFQNIFQILESFLPHKLFQQDFHFTVITHKELLNPKDKYDLIRKFLDQLKMPYNIKFGLYLADKIKPHDRDLISNYFRINVGHSFELFNEYRRPNKDTSITYFPINSESSPATHFKLLKTFASYTKEAICIGDKNNRLIEYFK
jgi:hypothetical protein